MSVEGKGLQPGEEVRKLEAIRRGTGRMLCSLLLLLPFVARSCCHGGRESPRRCCHETGQAKAGKGPAGWGAEEDRCTLIRTSWACPFPRCPLQISELVTFNHRKPPPPIAVYFLEVKVNSCAADFPRRVAANGSDATVEHSVLGSRLSPPPPMSSFSRSRAKAWPFALPSRCYHLDSPRRTWDHWSN